MRVYRVISREQVIQLQRALQRWENEVARSQATCDRSTSEWEEAEMRTRVKPLDQAGLHHTLHTRTGPINDPQFERRSSVEHLYVRRCS